MVPLLLTACTLVSDTEVEGKVAPPGAFTDTFRAEAPSRIDVLFVVDSSVSMGEVQTRLGDAVAAVMTGWADSFPHLGVTTMNPPGDGAGPIDWISEDCDAACVEAWLPKLWPGTAGSDQEAGLGAPIFALSPPLSETTNAEFLRVGALHAMVFVSDENDCTGLTDDGATGEDCYVRYDDLTPVGELLASTLALDPDGRVQLSGIIGPPSTANCDLAVPGTRYSEAIERLGGVEASICRDDFTGDLAAIQAKQLAPQDQFVLSAGADETTIQVVVADQGVDPGEANGWTYDAELRLVTLHGSAAPAAGDEVRVGYDEG